MARIRAICSTRWCRAFPRATVEDEDSLRVAVIGRPNVGKSSLVNRLLGEERLVVAAEAGTTRDAIDTPMQYHGQTLTFVDTAGLRRQSKIDDGIEFYSSLRTRRAIERAQICVLMLDAVVGLENQDLKIATLAWEHGCGLIVVVNKWDIKEEKTDKSAAKFQKEAGEKAPFLKFVPFLFTSGAHGAARVEGARARAAGGRGAQEAHHDGAGEHHARASSRRGCSRRRPRVAR